ncbi:hypothetical protein GJ744_004678 [Endocarpon pusillum]|uniref:Uncharacterized protein n=1 Tax=Endocarpon pusillum TaxID=364733 RepID=A0A8H7A5J6_9EURO|nr:hypothetical protein GJ744_004678 [Endocarpon pusillum]
MEVEETWIEESPEPPGRSEVPDVGARAAAEKQEKFVGDDVWLKGTPQGTIRLHVVNQRLHKKKWWLQLKSPGEEILYNDGAWYPQKTVSMAKKGPKHNV